MWLWYGGVNNLQPHHNHRTYSSLACQNQLVQISWLGYFSRFYTAGLPCGPSTTADRFCSFPLYFLYSQCRSVLVEPYSIFPSPCRDNSQQGAERTSWRWDLSEIPQSPRCLAVSSDLQIFLVLAPAPDLHHQLKLSSILSQIPQLGN